MPMGQKTALLAGFGLWRSDFDDLFGSECATLVERVRKS